MGFFNGTELKHNISRDELNKIISEHQIWLKHGNKPDESGKYGKQADLAYAILTATKELKGVDLRKANLQGAILDCADLSYTNLSGANLTETSFKYCNLEKTDISNSIGWNTANWSGTKTNSLILSSEQIRQKLNRLKGLIDKQINQLNSINENDKKGFFSLKKHQLHRLEKLQLFYQKEELLQIKNDGYNHFIKKKSTNLIQNIRNSIKKNLLNLIFDLPKNNTIYIINNHNLSTQEKFKLILKTLFFLYMIILISTIYLAPYHFIKIYSNLGNNEIKNFELLVELLKAQYQNYYFNITYLSILISLLLTYFGMLIAKTSHFAKVISRFILWLISILFIFAFFYSKIDMTLKGDIFPTSYYFHAWIKNNSITWNIYIAFLLFLMSLIFYAYNNNFLKFQDKHYSKVNRNREKHINLYKINEYYYSIMMEKNNEITVLKNKIESQEGQLDSRIKSAKETLSKALINADNGIQSNSKIAKKCGNMGMALFVLDFAFIFGGLIYLSWTMLHIDVNSLSTVSKSLKELPSWLVLLYTFPIVATMLIANALLRHQKKLLDEVRHFSAMKHQIELYSGLLEASQYAADSFNSKESASAYVEETFTRIRDRLLSENAPQSTNLSDSDKDELSDLMKKVLDNHIINQLGISSNKKEDKNDKDDKDDKKKDDEN